MLRTKSYLIFILVFLTGCASVQDTAKPEIQIVKVPVSQPCQQPIPAAPIFNFDLLKESDNLFEKTQALLADRKLHIAYEGELLAALKACK